MNISTDTESRGDVGELNGQNRDWRVACSVILAIVAAVTLLLMGQPLWCKCGGWPESRSMQLSNHDFDH